MREGDKEMTLDELRREYRPYHTIPAFDAGFNDYQRGHFLSPQGVGFLYGGVDAQAYDRGVECASRWSRVQEPEEGPSAA